MRRSVWRKKTGIVGTGEIAGRELKRLSGGKTVRRRFCILGYASVVLCQIRMEMVEPTGKVNP